MRFLKEWRLRRRLTRATRYTKTVVEDCGAMAWSDQAIARMSTTWAKRFLLKHRIRKQVFHSVMAVSFVLTAVMFAMSVTRFVDYEPIVTDAPKIQSINPWKAYCEAFRWSKGCRQPKPSNQKG